MKTKQGSPKTSVVDPNTLNLDPDPGFSSNLYPDPGPVFRIRFQGYAINYKSKKFKIMLEKNYFL